MTFLRLTFLLLAVVLLADSVAAECTRHLGPGKFRNTPATWGNDSGPIVDGFIDVRKDDGTVLKAEHGVDLSHYNRIDYGAFRDCGGKFAIVQMDAQFPTHAKGIQDKAAIVIPYFFFRLPSELLRASALLNGDGQEAIAALRKAYVKAGEDSAAKFLANLKTYNEIHNTNWPVESELAGLKGKFIAFDVEESPKGKLSASQTHQFGRGYAAAVCAWVRKVEAELKDVVPVIYTFPAIYGNYLTYAYPEENACLQGYPVWIARTYPSGGEALVNKDSPGAVDRYVQRLCRVPAGNRCIVHQYTHRGVFMAPSKGAKGGVPPHFDLNRFYHSEMQRSPSGVQFVRAEDPFR